MKPTTNEIKREIQLRAHDIWMSEGRVGTLAMATGAGKSYVAVHEAKRMWEAGQLSGPEDILLVVPTEVLRDQNWPTEFEKWGAAEVFNRHVKAVCFASLNREQGKKYKLVIMDEIHRLTELSAKAFLSLPFTGAEEESDDELTHFFAENLAEAVMGLTATVPDRKREPEKYAIIQQVAPVVFQYTLDQAVEEGMVANYEIRVILHQLDDKNKVIPAGTKLKPFKTTEFGHYQYLEKQIKQAHILAAQNPAKNGKLPAIRAFQRNKFLYNLPSRTELARKCLQKITGNGNRTLVLCGGIGQVESLLGEKVYHSKTTKAAYDAFNRKEIDELGAVQAIDEGVNLSDVNQLLIVSFDSSDRRLTQRIGRSLRGRNAVIYIICVQGTADERWLEKALGDLDRNKITYYSSKNL